MHESLGHRCFGIAIVVVLAHGACGQTRETATPETTALNLKLSVDEVSLTFHAADARGVPINDLKLDELTLLDNGMAPRRIIAFTSGNELPIRAGLVVDTSESMAGRLAADRSIAIQYARHLLRKETDQAFVMDFGYVSKIRQAWTNNANSLAAGVQQIVAGRENPLGGTALFDTVFRACFNLFGGLDHTASGNFILLFSDGEDNASYTSLPEVVNICQRSNTAIYVFRAEPNPSLFSSGPKTLRDLAIETGGRVFSDDDSPSAIELALRTIDADVRNQYRLVYSPAELKHDGGFRPIALKGPGRVANIVVRSGYYDRPR